MAKLIEMTTSDLILCINLLNEDARTWEKLYKGEDINALRVCNSMATDRRILATRLYAEVQKREPG